MLRRKRYPAGVRFARSSLPVAVPRKQKTVPQLSLFEAAQDSVSRPSALSPDDAPPAADAGLHRHRQSEGRRETAPRGAELWLCIRIIDLPLAAIPGRPAGAASVVSAEHVSGEKRGSANVHACDAAARAAGISAGMRLNAALALQPALRIYQRDPQAEKHLLERLARWAGRYTPVVCIRADDSLLLEVAGSLHLFGGMAAIGRDIVARLGACGLQVSMACAPAPRAALWLAQAGVQADCRAPDRLRGLIGNLPLGAAAWPDKVQQQLVRMGISTLGDCLRLPRDGFARRIGQRYLHELDAALGNRPEVIERYVAPATFAEAFEFDMETHVTTEIMQGVQSLLDRLRCFLVQRQLSVAVISLRLVGRQTEPEELSLRLREPLHEMTRLHELLSLKLDAHRLAGPLTAVTLRARLVPLEAACGQDLLTAGSATSEGGIVRLFERLRARLGKLSVYGVRLVADHRPEYAWVDADILPDTRPADVPAVLPDCPRPLWLLQRPVRLQVRERQLVHGGELLRPGEPERIESGWWDNAGVRRTYYTATSGHGRRWWVYREQSHWYLHGAFG